MKVKGLPSIIFMNIRFIIWGAQVEVSHDDTGTYGLQVVEYKCHGLKKKKFKERNNGVVCSNQIELVQALIIFFWVMNKESKLELFLSPHTIVQYDK